jgi:hypothetical protein
MSGHPQGRGSCHDIAANPGQFALADRELAILRLARLSGLFARTADLGGYRSRGGDHHLMARLARWGPDTASRRYLFAEAGGLIAFDSDFAERFRATFTSLIPRGAKRRADCTELLYHLIGKQRDREG